jgi:hypothetical protein
LAWAIVYFSSCSASRYSMSVETLPFSILR